MPRGGSRPGAGRPKGAKTILTEKAIMKAADGLMPLDYMLGILRDESRSEEQRMDAAKAAAPYVHARQIESKVQSENVNYTIADRPLTEDEWEREYSPDALEPAAGPAGSLN